YPNCRSVFGFWDTMQGVATAQLMYVVTGWHEDPQHDPVAKAPAAELLRKTHCWAMSTDAPPSTTLYSGLVQSVAWNVSETYISPASLAPITADVAIGGNPAEVMSAYFTAQ